MRLKEAIRALQDNKSKQFLLLGNEPYLKEQFIQAVRVLRSKANFLPFYPGEEKEAQRAFSMVSLFNDRVFFLMNFDKFKLHDVLISRSGRDIIVMSTTEDATVKQKLISKASVSATLVDCMKMRVWGDDYPLWIISKARDYDLEMADGAAERLYQCVGPNMMAISRELRKICLYKDKVKLVTPGDIDAAVATRVASTPYELLEKILRKDVAGALQCLDDCCRFSQDYVGIIGFLSAYFEKMYRIWLYKQRGLDAESMADILGIPAFHIKTKYLPRAVALGRTVLEGFLEAIVELDIKIRLFSADKKSLLEYFILQIAK